MRAVPKLEGKLCNLTSIMKVKVTAYLAVTVIARLTCTLTHYHEVVIYVDM